MPGGVNPHAETCQDPIQEQSVLGADAEGMDGAESQLASLRHCPPPLHDSRSSFVVG